MLYLPTRFLTNTIAIYNTSLHSTIIIYILNFTRYLSAAFLLAELISFGILIIEIEYGMYQEIYIIV